MKASEALDRIGEALVEDLRDPARRTGLVVTMATSAVCAKMGMRLIPALVFSVAAGFGAERMYQVIDDVHQAAIGIQRLELHHAPADPA